MGSSEMQSGEGTCRSLGDKKGWAQSIYHPAIQYEDIIFCHIFSGLLTLKARKILALTAATHHIRSPSLLSSLPGVKSLPRVVLMVPMNGLNLRYTYVI
jgi:hypothetical protein